MKINKLLSAMIASAGLGLSGQAFAAFTVPSTQTAAGTSISNTVSLDFTVDSVIQDQVSSIPVSFLVDTRVDLEIEINETAETAIRPKGQGYISTFSLANLSNEVLDFNLATADLSGTGITFLSGTVDDNFDLDANLEIFVESGANAGYLLGEDTATSVDNLAIYTGSGDEVVIYVVVTTDVSATQEDGDLSAISLTATARQADGSAIPDQTSIAFDKDTKQFVLADTGFNGSASVNTAFEVGTAKFTDPTDVTDTDKFTMTVKVINDTVCDSLLTAASSADYSAGGCPAGAPASYKPKAIPGAMVEYTISAKNSGSVDADSVTFSEDLSDIADADGDLSIDLVQNSIGNVAGTSTGAATIVEDTTDSNLLDVDFSVIAPDDVVTITFTAIVE
jgi:hypothetical protein